MAMQRRSPIKNEKMYTDLRRDGASNEKAVRIANAATARGTGSVDRKGGKAGSYNAWTVTELKKRAKDLDLSGYSKNKPQLVSALRNH
jgi:hypothetical protein